MSQSISTSSIRSLLALAERRDALLAEIERIDANFTKILNGGELSSVAPDSAGRRGRKPGTVMAARPVKRGKRGSVSELILAGLKEAGDAGIAVKHLAVKLGIKPQNIHVWLHTTGKKNGLVRAVGQGLYRLEESMSMAAPRESVEAPRPVRRRVRNKRTSG